MPTKINTAFLKLTKRAENIDRSQLVETFVDVGSLFTLLSNNDNQILYGRRGTGKTHAFYYLSDYVEKEGDISIQIDLRTLGSTGGIYSDPSLSISERSTRLLVDTLSELHENLFEYIIDHDDELDLSRFGPLLDQFVESISEVSVEGPVEQEEIIGENSSNSNTSGVEIGLSNSGFNVSGELNSNTNNEQSHSIRRRVTGNQRHRIHFGNVFNKLNKLMDEFNSKKVWLLLDEWSEVPLDIQPYLADLLRRTVFPIRKIAVKIAAIEQRCKFRILDDNTGYIGVEVGADTSPGIDLDEFMVFDNDAEKAKSFFAKLIYKHIAPILSEEDRPDSAEKLINEAFTQTSTFDEFVRAAEGVPRDAINILGIAAQKADQSKIKINDIRVAAQRWYNRAKERTVSAREKAHDLLRWIIDEVISHRRARAFLLRSDIRHELIDFLFDARVLHIVKNSVSAHDKPGLRFKVYSIDYGCYVDLINTSRAPMGLFEVETENGAQYVEVPVTDYRSIRRAILNLDEFENNY